MTHQADGKRVVVAVMLAREHLPFIRGWCEHHVAQGWSICLYDNSGSTGSNRESSIFSKGYLQRSGYDKRGRNYAAYTADLSDADVRQALLHELRGLPVELCDWHPRNAEGDVIHGQVAAYVDFIRRYRARVDWAAFIDCDEYLQTGAGLSWTQLLHELNGISIHRALLRGITYGARWSENGRPLPLESLPCGGEQERTGEPYNGCKNIVRLSQVERADIHWYWQMTGGNRMAVLDAAQFHFKHYKLAEQPLRYENLPGFQPTGVLDESEPV